MARKAKAGPKPVEVISHKDKRANIPTEELRDFVAGDEAEPKKLLYERESSLDPQLVWKGKDEQDRNDLEVPVVPVYIQEKIHPKALVENLRDAAGPEEAEPELKLFDDFNGIEFEELIDFYAHEQNWANRMILGDSLLVMTSLAEKEGLKGKVQMIYMDPPYGIDFASNWQVSTRHRDLKDGRAEDLTRQPEQIRAFRDTWELGIHSYLSYLRDRLVVARDLLTESGSAFLQIGEKNVHLVRSLLDEVFGPDSFVAQIVFRKKTMPLGATYLERMHDYILWYGKSPQSIKYHALFRRQNVQGDFHWTWYEMPDELRHLMSKEQNLNHDLLPDGSRPYRLVSMWPPSYDENAVFPVEYDGRAYEPPPGQCWPTGREGMERIIKGGRVQVEGQFLRLIVYLDASQYSKWTSLWTDTIGARDQRYVVETNTSVVQRCMLMSTDPGDLIVDPTCGSGTTAYVAEQWGRRWITVDTSRVALALARTRLMTARYPYYLLADSPEGLKKQAELDGQVPDLNMRTDNDVRRGFVYKTVPHVTLKSIANNPDIKEGMTREEIDEAIANHAEKEVLYDKPYEDSKRLRVTGPFTVESLSPHRTVDADEQKSASEYAAQIDYDAGQFESTIIENLRKAGVQNTIKQERLNFDRLERFAGKWIQAEGEYTDSDGVGHRVAVSVGPEHGTVEREQVKEAAKEALKGIGFDVLVVCGFAFDPHVSEEAKQYGKLTVLPARMNPDLAMGDELLKKTGAGNLFMVFGEPDLDIIEEDGKIVVEIRGLDVYDPTTGQIRSNSTDDIACWFLDTNYNGESFFVRHAYFTGADKPYEKLKKALRADIDETAWESLYSTRSRPFDKPATGSLAVKVINHYGDEVLKVYAL